MDSLLFYPYSLEVIKVYSLSSLKFWNNLLNILISFNFYLSLKIYLTNSLAFAYYFKLKNFYEDINGGNKNNSKFKYNEKNFKKL